MFIYQPNVQGVKKYVLSMPLDWIKEAQIHDTDIDDRAKTNLCNTVRRITGMSYI